MEDDRHLEEASWQRKEEEEERPLQDHKDDSAHGDDHRNGGAQDSNGDGTGNTPGRRTQIEVHHSFEDLDILDSSLEVVVHESEERFGRLRDLEAETFGSEIQNEDAVGSHTEKLVETVSIVHFSWSHCLEPVQCLEVCRLLAIFGENLQQRSLLSRGGLRLPQDRSSPVGQNPVHLRDRIPCFLVLLMLLPRADLDVVLLQMCCSVIMRIVSASGAPRSES